MFLKYSFLVINVFIFCDSAFVDTLSKCKLGDGKCQIELLQKVIHDIAKTGIPEYEIPPIDPVHLTNITLKVLDLVEVTLVEGTIRGIKTCVIGKMDVDIERDRGTLELTCDLVGKGRYKAFSSSPLVKTFLNGNTVRGDGNAKIKIEKLYMKFDFVFHIKKKNGDYFAIPDFKKIKYDYNVNGRMLFYADQIYIGEVESSKTVLDLLNNNWKILLSSFGRPLIDTGLELAYSVVGKFFESLPVTAFISDDLSPYAQE